jgi:hypothetical protein
VTFCDVDSVCVCVCMYVFIYLCIIIVVMGQVLDSWPVGSLCWSRRRSKAVTYLGGHGPKIKDSGVGEERVDILGLEAVRATGD